MKPGFLEILLAIAVGVSALAIFAMCALGIVVWLAGGRRIRTGDVRRRD
ncbi:MAG TPA: hypothetical protein VEB66_15245 [Opitutaceae bacterium]|nr:hypothetical protein [Opitutaceae bacterium]